MTITNFFLNALSASFFPKTLPVHELGKFRIFHHIFYIFYSYFHVEPLDVFSISPLIHHLYNNVFFNSHRSDAASVERESINPCCPFMVTTVDNTGKRHQINIAFFTSLYFHLCFTIKYFYFASSSPSTHTTLLISILYLTALYYFNYLYIYTPRF